MTFFISIMMLDGMSSTRMSASFFLGIGHGVDMVFYFFERKRRGNAHKKLCIMSHPHIAQYQSIALFFKRSQHRVAGIVLLTLPSASKTYIFVENMHKLTCGVVAPITSPISWAEGMDWAVTCLCVRFCTTCHESHTECIAHNMA